MAVKLPEGVLPRSVNFKPPYDDRAAHVVMNMLHYEFKVEVHTVTAVLIVIHTITIICQPGPLLGNQRVSKARPTVKFSDQLYLMHDDPLP